MFTTILLFFSTLYNSIFLFLDRNRIIGRKKCDARSHKFIKLTLWATFSDVLIINKKNLAASTEQNSTEKRRNSCKPKLYYKWLAFDAFYVLFIRISILTYKKYSSIITSKGIRQIRKHHIKLCVL